MVEVSAEVDQVAVARLDGLFKQIRREAPGRLAKETQRAAIYICQSLRARTKKAPKRSRRNEYSLNPIKGGYITKDGRLLHQWEFVRFPETASAKRKVYAAYSGARRVKTGNGWRWHGKNLTQERAEVIKSHDLLTIRRAGLAKLSWGWVMKQIYNGAGAGDITWKRTKGERRDPRLYVKGLFLRTATGAGAAIDNNLDYILDALQPGALAVALNAASKKLKRNVEEEVKRMTAA